MGLAVCGVDAIGWMVQDACVPWRAEPTPSASPAGPGGLHCGRRRPCGRYFVKQAEGRRDAGVWMLAHAYGMCVGGWRAVQVVPVARCGAACGAHRCGASRQASSSMLPPTMRSSADGGRGLRA